MRNQEKLMGILIIILILFIASNINGINSFLSGTTEKTIEFGHSASVVPAAWNTTKELNQTNRRPYNLDFGSQIQGHGKWQLQSSEK